MLAHLTELAQQAEIEIRERCEVTTIQVSDGRVNGRRDS